jgi:glycosyltransferase involved in cell wall biosynthesis
MLLVGMDGQSLMGGGSTGLGRYTQSLIDAFSEWGGEVRVKLYQPKGREVQSGFKSSLQRLKWEQFEMPLTAMKEDLDLFHTPCFSLPAMLKLPRVMTIHDIIITKRPRLMKGFSRYYFGKIIPWSAKYADHVITNSETTKKDVIKYLKLPSHKVTALELAPTISRNEMIPNEIVNRFHARNKIHTGYILFVGSFEPRKNIEALVDQFRGVVKAYPDVKLVLSGGLNSYQQQIKEKVRKMGILGNVVFPGYIERRELIVAYRDCLMVVNPSLDEGFGLPIVEAMEMGRPVIASKIPAHIESAGGAAMLFDLGAERQLGQAMLSLIENEKQKNEMIEKGYHRVQQLSWSVNARKTIEIYYKIVKETREKRGSVKKRKGFG